MTERVLLTGATGRIGRHIARRLATSRLKIVGVGRRDDVLQAATGELGREVFLPRKGDLTSRDFLRALAGDGPFDALIHAAAAVENDLSLRELYARNAAATGCLLECLKGCVRHVVYFSSIDVYGRPKSCPIKEDHVTRPNSLYGASKLAGEEYVRLFAADQNIPAVVLRISSVFGSGGNPDRAMSVFLRNALAGRQIEVMGDGSELRDYVHVEDVVDGCCRAMERSLDGVFNLGGGAPISIRDLAYLAREIAQSPAGIEHTGRTGSVYDLYLDVRKLKGATEYSPRASLREGMTRELEFLRTASPH